MTENSMFSITKIIFCIVSEPFISDYIEPDPYNSLRGTRWSPFAWIRFYNSTHYISIFQC